MKNFDKYAEAGAKAIGKNDRYNLQMSDFLALDAQIASGEISLFEAIEKAFDAGVEAGRKIEKKKQAAKNPN